MRTLLRTLTCVALATIAAAPAARAGLISGPRMIDPPQGAASAVDIFVKDLGIVLDAARASRFPVPVSAAALQVFLGASGAGFGRSDDSQATRFYEALGGKPVRKQ